MQSVMVQNGTHFSMILKILPEIFKTDTVNNFQTLANENHNIVSKYAHVGLFDTSKFSKKSK